MIEIGAVYRHFKNGKTYRVIGVGRHSETLEELVVYQALYESADFAYGQIWCRPAKMWSEIKDGRPRFEKLSDE